ncbi:hypothetical protein [Caldibacillus debilis]|jgi:hypothetical protein|uniref:hypothetical protein n=1 Tax=Caldibacillus debilis TaxID=301148 RepID=UPI0016002C5B|nr:hypothetical protein [Caldibacillus debilis]
MAIFFSMLFPPTPIVNASLALFQFDKISNNYAPPHAKRRQDAAVFTFKGSSMETFKSGTAGCRRFLVRGRPGRSGCRMMDISPAVMDVFSWMMDIFSLITVKFFP